MFKAYQNYIDKHISNQWLYENLRQAPILLVFQVLFLLLWLIIVIASPNTLFSEHTIHFVLFQIELLVIPLCAINTIYLVQKKISSKTPHSKRIIYKLIATVIGVLIGTAITESIYAYYGIVDDDIISLGEYKIDPVTTNFISYSLFSLFIGIPLFIRQARRYELQLELQDKEINLQKAKQLLAQAELETLQAKINPHFLYNSLNSIAGLIHDEPDKAEKMVIALSDLFRYSLNTQGKAYTTVAEEIEMVNTYLEIEKTRFDEQLQYTINIDEESKTYLIPRFLIQPLIENAIKHGTSKKEKGIMELTVAKNATGLSITVKDNGPQFPLQLQNGYGVKSVLEKLELLFPNAHEFSFTNEPEKYISIEIHQLKTQANEVLYATGR